MKVCYFIQSHKNVEQIRRLVFTIKRSSPDSQILLNHDFSSCYLDLNELRQFSGIDVIERRKPARRGDSSILDIFLAAIRWLFEHQRHFDWLICLSGQDYPIQPIARIEEYLSKTDYDGFLRYWDLLLETPIEIEARERKRYFAQYFCLPEWTQWSLRKTSRLEPLLPVIFQWQFALIGFVAQDLPFRDRFRCYRGYYWNTLSRKCLEFFLSYLDDHSELLRYYRRTLAPEESILQTVLVNSNQFNLCNDDLRYMEFPPELRGNARLLTVEDYDKITSSNAHFARKFDIEQDSQILDWLDAQIAMISCR